MKKISIKTQININIKKQNGSITLYTIISMLFFLIMVSGLYINSSYRVQKQNKEIQKIQEEYKKDDINDIYEKTMTSNEKLLSEVVKVGDYVKYKADTASTDELINDLTTYSGNTDTSYNTSSTIKQENLNWRVLDITDEGEVRLISELPTNSTIALYGAKGYNNAVYLLDKTCNELYNNKIYAKKVQSLKIEDIQKYLNYDYTQQDIGVGKYGEISEYTEFRNYPNIYTKEKTGYVDGVKGTELDLSEQVYPINEDFTEAKTSIKTTQTHWNKMLEKTDFLNEKYYEIFMNNGNYYTTYWMSSRSVNTYSDHADFGIKYVDSGCLHMINIYNSYNNYYADITKHALRPVVTLKSDVLINSTKSGDGTEVSKAWVLI